jgi:hypothetical protein
VVHVSRGAGRIYGMAEQLSGLCAYSRQNWELMSPVPNRWVRFK